MHDLDLSLPLPRDRARDSQLALLDSPDPLFDAFDGEPPRRPGRHFGKRRAQTQAQQGRARSAALLGLLVACVIAAPACSHEESPAVLPDAILVQLHEASRLPDWTLRDESGPQLIPLDSLGPDGEPPLLRLPVPAGRSARELADELSRDPAVAFAEPITFAQPLARPPDDPRFKDLWGLSAIHAPAAWETTVGDRAVTVAVIDNGLALSHPDLRENLWNNPRASIATSEGDGESGFAGDLHGASFLGGVASGDPSPDPSGSAPWHGTHAAGIIGAVGGNRVGITGVNWRVSLMGLRALGPKGGRSDDLAQAIDYASLHGARVINASWSGAPSAAVAQAIERAGRGGALFVAAAGNDGAAAPGFPANLGLPCLLSVGALDATGALAAFSNRGARVAAPGVGVLSTSAPGSYERADGTSVAAPHVAGLAALLFAAHPQASVDQVREAILSSSVALPGVERGRVDAERAMSALAASGESESSDLFIARESLRFESAGHPLAQEIELRAANGGSTGFTARSDSAWANVSPRAATTPARLLVRVDPRDLAPGDHHARIEVKGAAGESHSLAISLVVGAEPRVTALGALCSTSNDGRVRVARGALCTLLAPGYSEDLATPGASWILPGGAERRGASLTALYPRRGSFTLRARSAFEQREVVVEVE